MKKISFTLILLLCFGMISCKSNLVSKNPAKEEILLTIDYMVYKNESSKLTEYIDPDKLKDKTEDEVTKLLGEPTYIVQYKSKDSSIFDCKILIYSYSRSTDGTSLDFKNNIYTSSYTDSIDSMDSYKIENLVNIFNK